MIPLLQEPNLGKKKIFIPDVKSSLFAHFQSSQNPMHGTKASDKLKEIALQKMYPYVNS